MRIHMSSNHNGQRIADHGRIPGLMTPSLIHDNMADTLAVRWCYRHHNEAPPLGTHRR